MSRTERTRIRWDDTTEQWYLHRDCRDDKGRCYCCGNTQQKQANKRARQDAKRAIRTSPDAA